MKVTRKELIEATSIIVASEITNKENREAVLKSLTDRNRATPDHTNTYANKNVYMCKDGKTINIVSLSDYKKMLKEGETLNDLLSELEIEAERRGFVIEYKLDYQPKS